MHTLEYERCFFLAQGGRDEAISSLHENWTDISSNWFNYNDGQYQYEISSMSPNKKRVISKGRINNIEQKMETIVEKSANVIDFQQLKQYTIFCEGNFNISDLDSIQSNYNEPLIAVNGDISIDKNLHGVV